MKIRHTNTSQTQNKIMFANIKMILPACLLFMLAASIFLWSSNGEYQVQVPTFQFNNETEHFETEEQVFQRVQIRKNEEKLKQVGVYSWHKASILPSDMLIHPDTEILVLVFIRANYNDSRAFIRSSLGKIAPEFKYQILFVTGIGPDTKDEDLLGIKQENELNQDIIVTDVEDTYFTVCLKAINAFHWVWQSTSSNPNKLKWIIKLDEDTLINPQELNRVLQDNQAKIDEKHIICSLMYDRPVFRDPNSRWYVPKYVYQEETYPNYCLGPLYALSIPAMESILEMGKADFRQDFLWIEDVYLTGILAKKGHFSAESPNRFMMLYNNDNKNQTDFVAFHMGSRSIEERNTMWNKILAQNLSEK